MGWAKILDNIPLEGKLSKLAGVWVNPGRRGDAELPPSPGEQGRGANCSAHTLPREPHRGDKPGLCRNDVQIRDTFHILGSSPVNSHALWISIKKGGKEEGRECVM